MIIISTKEKIKQAALSLFAKKGYYGTSISDIAAAVGINKSSLYSHYSGKEEVFLAVFEDVAREHGLLFDQLSEGSKNLEIQDQLRYHFKEYILYLHRNREIQCFLNSGLFHVPPELYEKLRASYLNWEMLYRKKLEDIFEQGMQQRLIRNGNPGKRVWSFKMKRDGVAAWLIASPDLDEECIEEFWNDFWFGVRERNED